MKSITKGLELLLPNYRKQQSLYMVKNLISLEISPGFDYKLTE